jgi:uncharacterized Ntn-hydrolase superfamily protein
LVHKRKFQTHLVARDVAVGALVPYAAPGAGAIATQAVVNPMYGIRGLELVRYAG